MAWGGGVRCGLLGSFLATAALAATLASVSAVASTTTCGNAIWDQCAGSEIEDSSRCCPAGSVCKYENQWYSQCAPATDSLAGGDILFYGTSIWSTNGNYWMVQQATDGNLVLYTNVEQKAKALWSSNTAVGHTTEGVLQLDGNLVIYSDSNHSVSNALFSTKTSAFPNATAKIQNDGNFVIRDASGAAVWATGTCQTCH